MPETDQHSPTPIAANTATPCDSDELAEWLAATAAGDRNAFRSLYDRTSVKLFRLALLLLQRQDAAEDVLQEAFLRIWSEAGQYDPALGAPGPWLARIVRNAAIDRLRRERPAHEDIMDHAARLAAIPIAVQDRLDLSRALGTVAGKQRAAVTLSVVEGYTNAEIAARLRAPLGTVKTWIRRGTERLRVQLEA